MNVGILGGGQLARMLAQAGKPLGHDCIFLCPASDACAAVFGEHLQAGFEEPDALEELASCCDVVTCEFENVPAASLRYLEARTRVHPSSLSLEISRDRLLEKDRLRSLGIATAPYAPVSGPEQLYDAAQKVGLPALLKTRTLGYDGKGQTKISRQEDLLRSLESLGGVPCILEALIPFDRELSIIGVRTPAGDKAFYPLSENRHREGILRLSLSRSEGPLQRQAEALLSRLLDDLEHVGVLTLELFQQGEELLANEMAARVHNSGHWTIEGAHCSQFENHLRAVTGMCLGGTGLVRPAAMVNIIGSLPEATQKALASRGFLHVYGKSPRPGRKLGHVTLLADKARAEKSRQMLAECLELVGENRLARQVSSGETGFDGGSEPVHENCGWLQGIGVGGSGEAGGSIQAGRLHDDATRP